MTDLNALPPVADVRDTAAIEATGWPTDLPPTTYDLLRRSAAAFGAATALSFFIDAVRHRETRDWSYRALFGEVTRAANLLAGLGVGRTDVVAYILPNLPETHFVLWGAEAAGIALAVNPMLDTTTIRDILRAANARVVVTLAPFPGNDLNARAIAAADGAESVSDIVLVDVARHVGGLRRLAARVVGWRARRGMPAPIRAAVHDYTRLRDRAPGDRLRSEREPTGYDVSSYFCTGGTTGTPKIAVRRHANEVANAWMSSRMAGSEAHPGDTAFCGLPLFHVNAAMVTGLAAFLRGARVLLGTPHGYRAPGLLDRFWEIVAHHDVVSFSGVPTLYAGLLQKPIAGHDLSSLRYVYCGAAPMPAEQIRAFEAQTGVVLLEGYGLTEGTCVSSVNPIAGERRPGSIGIRLPFQGLRAVVLDEQGLYARDAATDEAGAIVISGANVFDGYLSAYDNADIWIDRGDGQRWFNTGDLGRIDVDGYVWLTGRAKDVIIRGGHNIDPATVEDALYAHPAVELVAAIGRPDAYAGEVPVAYVQLRAGHTASEADLLAFARDRVGEPAAKPKAVLLLEAMPLTAVGKIFKPTLREIETLRVAREALAEAGITPAAVTARRDPSRGLTLSITVDPDHRKLAQATLSAYAMETIVTSA
jgi:fatty-acyl-CoA synthase